jgi:N-sulfoglucosamine sulfohydrolase
MKHLFCLTILFPSVLSATAADRPNVLIITVDDMSADSLGAFGCEVRNTSPNIDKLAAQGFRFNRAHVVVGNCMPSRNVMWSGLYPHNNGVEGFYQVPDATHKHLADLMHDAGYYTGIFHKVAHSTPYHPYDWDVNLDTAADGRKRHIKHAADYGDATAQGIAEATSAGKPFCLMINVADPHKPFFAQGRDGSTVPDEHVPSHVFTADDVTIPGFLFDDPVVRKELGHYYSSVRRADDCVGRIIAALDASGLRENTVILFLSDHGMALPFAKTQLYHHSSNTPMFVIWPGVTQAGTIDDTHMVSAVDLLPTLLEITGVEHPGRMDGRSFASILRGETQDGRDFVIKEYNENAGASRDPMRAVQTKDYLYLFNAWSDGKRIMATATTGTPTYRQLAKLAKTDPLLAARHDLYQHRVLEEFFLVQDDPDCLVNLVDSVSHQEELSQLRGVLQEWMEATEDPMREVFERRGDRVFVASWMKAQEAEAAVRRASKRKGKARRGASANRQPGRQQRRNLIRFELPETVVAGQPVTIRIHHKLPKNLGEKVLTVTLKAGNGAERLDRKTVRASGMGTAEVSFDVPKSVQDNVVSFAAFVGSEFQTSLQHVQSKSIPCEAFQEPVRR